jgi:hypothetical protein
MGGATPASAVTANTARIVVSRRFMGQPLFAIPNAPARCSRCTSAASWDEEREADLRPRRSRQLEAARGCRGSSMASDIAENIRNAGGAVVMRRRGIRLQRRRLMDLRCGMRRAR